MSREMAMEASGKAAAWVSSSSSTSAQLKAHERLADYPKRMERLKRLRIDICGGGQNFTEVITAGTSGRRGASPMRRSSSPRGETSPVASVRPARRDASPRTRWREVSPAPHEPIPSVSGSAPPRVARPKREPRRESTPPRREASPASAARGKAKAAASRTRGGRGGGRMHIPDGGPLTRRQIEELMSRDLTPEDYELLLLLDEGVKKKSVLSTEAASILPRATGTDWIDQECRICLCALEEDEDVRMLPTCGHLFHAPCAERWLSSSKNTCPLCGRVEEVTERVIEAFARFDTNRDGLVNAAEMKKVLVKLDPSTWTDDAVQILFIAMDLDCDGKIDVREFINWIFAAGAGEKQRLLREGMKI